VQTQVKCVPYRTNLVKGRLAIECDGKQYDSSLATRAHDGKKNAYLEKQGYIVMQISGSSIVNRLPHVSKRVKARLI